MSKFHPNDPGIEDRCRGAKRVELPPGLAAVEAGPATLQRVPRYDDERGTLVVNQSPGDLPFSPARMFQVFGVPQGEMRGDHAHHRCHQYLIAVRGVIDVVVDDGRGHRAEVTLDSPELGLHIPPLVWAIQRRFAGDALLIVLASEPYDRSEYIDHYDHYLAIRRS